MKPIRIRNAQSFLISEVADCLIEMLKTNPQAEPGKAFATLMQHAHDPEVGIFITSDYSGAAVCILPVSGLGNYASLYHLHGKGEARKVLMEAMTQYCRESGTNRLVTANINDKDRGFKKLYGQHGNVKRIGTLYELEI